MEARILTVSSKGQLSLPTEIRRKLNISTGDKMVAYASGDVIILKTLHLPSAEEFKESLDESQRWAVEVGYTEDDVSEIIRSVRERKHK